MTAKSKSPRPARDTMPRRKVSSGGAHWSLQLLFSKYSRRRLRRSTGTSADALPRQPGRGGSMPPRPVPAQDCRCPRSFSG